MTESKASTATAKSEDELAFAGLEAQALMLVGGEVSSEELTELCLRRIAASQPTLNAFRVVCEEAALEEAAAADKRLSGGDGAPLLGVPIAIKDDVDLAGQHLPLRLRRLPRTGQGGRGVGATPPGRRRDRDRQDQRAGGRPVAVHRVSRFRRDPNSWNRRHGRRLKRWRRSRGCGGARRRRDRLRRGRLGPHPSRLTGLVGLKPQRGRISTWPDPEAFNGLSCFGPLTRSVADAALLLDAVASNREGDLHRPPPHSKASPRLPLTAAAAASRPLFLLHGRRPGKGRP